MPDIPDRLTREDELTRDLNTQFARQRQVVRSANDTNVPWSTFQSGIELAFITHLGATFEIARRLFLVERAATDEELALFLFLIGSGDLPLGRAGPRFSTPAKAISGEDWARGVAGPLASRVVQKSQEGVSRAAIAGEAAGRSQDEPSSADAASKQAFQDGIKTSFSETRAESIAVTETTGAVSAGEGSAAEIVEKQENVVLSKIWVTEKDARVCPICEPLHKKPANVWESRFPNGPPAHPRCRCWLVWRDSQGRGIGTVS